MLNANLMICFVFISTPGDVYLIWMGLMVIAYLYNAITIPLRASFELYRLNTSDESLNPYLVGVWLIFDYMFDLMFLLDIILVQSHLSYLRHGVVQVIYQLAPDNFLTSINLSPLLLSSPYQYCAISLSLTYVVHLNTNLFTSWFFFSVCHHPIHVFAHIHIGMCSFHISVSLDVKYKH